MLIPVFIFFSLKNIYSIVVIMKKFIKLNQTLIVKVIKMSMKRNLTSIVLGCALTLGIVNCSGKSNENKENENFTQYNTERISGKIIDIDEDSVGCHHAKNSYSAVAAQFEYETLFVVSEEKVRKILAPQPTSYRIGDTFDGIIILQPKISFDELVKDYSVNSYSSDYEAFQKGYLKIDGIMQINETIQK